MFKKIDFSEFPQEREEGLKNLWRFSMFEVMFYRSNLWMHTHRMLWMLEELLPYAKKYLPKFDPEKARALALVHDDAEMITGDIQAGHKAAMTKKQLQKVDEREYAALVKLSKKYPKKIHGYSYKTLLEEALYKNTPEAELIMYIDKMDGFCDSLHEVFAGNLSLLQSVIFYARVIPKLPQKYPRLAPLLSKTHLPFTCIDERSFLRNLVERKVFRLLGKPPTRKNPRLKTNFNFYNKWEDVVLKRGGQEGKDWLTTKRESF